MTRPRLKVSSAKVWICSPKRARLIMEGLREEMEPMLEEIQPFLEDEMLPFMQGMADMMDDITAYHPPERLPNGDIIIRRRDDAPDLPEIGEGGEVEL
ncbi:hypothetical protein QTA57_02540 [Fontisubflavum oceani]|uniref:hypothetical protein n=1 Tax=Fontisubflavum oceani TaxID=2978973 RepID=UPI0025B426BF|nr:hypothetical protein [Fontisubflavum oceani]WJY22075.1 hypothetical protein QTA57_02540 [Fontisubflavum oceani]